MEIRSDLFYTKSHEWVRFEDETTAVVGLTDYAQGELGDLVFVNLPQVGGALVAGEVMADVESVKAVSDVYAPVSGTVAAVNEELLDSPQRINEAPYDAWLCRVEGVEGREGLLDSEAYRALVG